MKMFANVFSWLLWFVISI